MDTMDPVAPIPPRRVVRSTSNRWMAGVCGGLAEYFKVDANLVRLIFVVMTICWGIGIPMYLFAWLIIPREGNARSIGENLVSRVDQVPPAAPNGN